MKDRTPAKTLDGVKDRPDVGYRCLVFVFLGLNHFAVAFEVCQCKPFVFAGVREGLIHRLVSSRLVSLRIVRFRAGINFMGLKYFYFVTDVLSKTF